MEEFYNDWFKNSKYWFNSNINFDNYLKNTYGYLIDIYEDNKSKPIYGILIYDQLTRHYYRNEKANHIISYYNRKALEIAKNEIENLENYIYNEWMFIILVFRHTNEKKHILFAMKEAWKRGSKSFIKATYNRANYTEELEYYDCSKDYYNYYNYNKEILDNNPSEEILKKTTKYIGDYSKLPKNNLIIVSLSGGVDSISCLYSLVKLYGNNRIVAIHINYNNRKETEDECDFLIWYCNKLEIKLYIRTIREIQREEAIKNDMREIYENYTKRVRFNSYKKVFELEKGIGEPIVILGHNKDDCLENILTNIAYKNKYDNLKGIEIIMKIENINFYRPIIEISKKEIYEYAKIHNLPYLKNSTPIWCQRGKIRTSVVPILEKWDKRIIEGLFNMTGILKDLHINLLLIIDKDFKKRNNININDLNTSILYWKYGIYKLYNIYVSNKSLNSLIERLKQIKENYKKKEINKKNKIIINKTINLLIWKSKNENEIIYEFIIDNKNN